MLVRVLQNKLQESRREEDMLANSILKNLKPEKELVL
jgi:hypothetical protein